MQISTTIKPEIKQSIQSAHEKALHQLVNNRQFATIIPMHTSNMRILVSDDDDFHTEIKSVIIPDLAIYVDKSGYRQGQIARDHIGYKIAYNQAAFPLAHVFDESGWLCLGTIFVPNLIPIHSPQQPLETLFLHNDRNINHGHPKIKANLNQQMKIKLILRNYNLDTTDCPSLKTNWVKSDTLWRLGNYLLQHCDKSTAYDIMNQIFHVIFVPRSKSNNVQ